MRTYATTADWRTWTGDDAATIDTAAARRASLLVEGAWLQYARYDVGVDGMPTNPTALAAVANAVCAQIEYWATTKDDGRTAQWNSESIGARSRSRSSATTGEGTGSTRLCSDARSILNAAARDGHFCTTVIVHG